MRYFKLQALPSVAISGVVRYNQSMKESKEQSNRSFIRERIQPKKNGKKIALIIVATILLGIVFGAAAGLTFFISQNALGKNDVMPETLPPLFLRDDTTESEEESAQPSASGEDILAPSEENPDNTESSEAEESEPAPITLSTIYAAARDSVVRVLLKQPAGEDWLGEAVVNRRETFAAAVSENDDAVFLLLDLREEDSDTGVEVIIGSTVYETALYGRDAITGLGIIRLPKESLFRPIPVLELGNSITLAAGERVFMIGAPFGYYGAIEEGRITYAGNAEPTIDGYRQRYYTDMARSEGNAAVLLNESGKIVGWVSDYASESMPVAVASGISPLKYIIEDLCLREKTAFMGVRCRVITNLESSESGLSAGLYVLETIGDSPAYASGIQPGDRIVKINDQMTSSLRTLQTVMDGARPGETATVVVSRATAGTEQQLSFEVVFAER